MNTSFQFFCSVLLLTSYGIAEDFRLNELEASELLKSTGIVSAHYEMVDVSKIDSKLALFLSDASFKYGVSGFLENGLKNYTTDQMLLQTGEIMAAIFSQGNIYVPTSINLEDTNLKKNVGQIYDLILNNFCWENDHSTEVLDFEVGAQLILRARLKKLKALWE